MGEGHRLDDLARDLASGAISRRTALRRLAAGALGVGFAAAPSALADQLERGNCPKKRRCGKKCCPKGAKCKNGKCKCKAGKTKCGKECADLTSDPKHCGTCGNTCDEGRACVDSQCEQCSVAEDCPEPSGDCQVAICQSGFCGQTQAAPGTVCLGNGVCDENGTCILDICGDGFVTGGEQCDDGNTNDGDGCDSNCQVEPGFICQGEPSVCVTTCGDGIIAGAEVCDGSNLNGQTCQSQGFSSGTLACSGDCMSFDTSGCVA